MTLRKLIENTTAASSPSWTIPSIIFTAGWWKFWAKGIRTRSENIPTPHPRAIISTRHLLRAMPRFAHSRCSTGPLRSAMARSALALLLIISLPSAGSFDTFAQSRKPKKKSSKPKSPPCRTGCKPDTSAPSTADSSPEAIAAQHELSLLAADLHRGMPGAYEKLMAFAAKNSANVWGSRAALALGYDDVSKSHAASALAWFVKAKNDPLLADHVLYWSSQAKHALNRNAESLVDLAAIQKDYPNTAIKEPVVVAVAAQSVEAGHYQAAIDALNNYSATSTKPALLLLRAHAYQLAGKLLPAAKDYQTIFYKFPLADEAKPASSALTQLNKQLHSEFPYATAEMQ